MRVRGFEEFTLGLQSSLRSPPPAPLAPFPRGTRMIHKYITDSLYHCLSLHSVIGREWSYHALNFASERPFQPESVPSRERDSSPLTGGFGRLLT